MMATIRHDVEIELDLESAEVQAYDRQKVMELFQELEFRSLIDRLPEQSLGEEYVASEEIAPQETLAASRAMVEPLSTSARS